MAYPVESSSPVPSTVELSSPMPFLVSRKRSIDKPAAGIHVTWKNLRVTVAAGRRPVLQGITGYVRPAEVLAVMGPSGCGKSTLLDAIAGRLGSSTNQMGDILINGRKQELAYGTSAYVTQDDTLVATLTVREAVYYSAQLQLPDSMSKSDKKARAEATIKEMGLEDCMDTRIGGWHVKGLSGGQKRRVSICIEILRRPKLLFLDEPTSGLDSAASYHVVRRIIKLAQNERISVVASIHQPSSEVFELFHNLCLLSSGQTVYFGPTLAANEFFGSNGFICPAMRNPSDHYLRTINQDFDNLEEEEVEEGYGGKKGSAEEAIKILVKAYESSEIARQVKLCVDEICQQNMNGLVEKKGSQAGFIRQCVVLTRRSSVNMFRDVGYYWFRFIVHVLLCISVGTVFHDIGFTYNSIQARGSALVFMSTFMTFMAIGGFPSFAEDMKIFSRERLNGHYTAAAFAIGNTLSSIPYLLLSLAPGAMSYYLVGLQKSLNHFAYFSLLLFCCMMLIESLMMVVAAVVPNFLVGVITGAGLQGVAILTNGFFRLPNDIPKPLWKIPLYYVSFHNYANQGFYKNEFHGLTFTGGEFGGKMSISGDEILRDVWQMQMDQSKWIDLCIIVGMTILLRFTFWGIIRGGEKFRPVVRNFLTPSPKHH